MKHLLFIILALASSIINVSAQLEIPARLSDRPELILHHTGYTLSYNIAHGTPNWAAWMLTKSHLSGHEPRSPQFFADSLVPIAYRVQPTDYQGSGYDRGHLYPAADASWSKESMHDCFYMTNMAPQTPTLNRVYWKQLESACRKWVLTEDTLYIVCGPIYQGTYKKLESSGELVESTRNKKLIHVPTGFFKVILSLRKGHAKAIGFYYVNNSQKQSLQATATSVDAIEKLTGIDFFHTLDDRIENAVETQCDVREWK